MARKKLIHQNDKISIATPPPEYKKMVRDFEGKIMGVGGAIGIGKTFAILVKLLVAAMSIKPINGVRRSRFIISRTVSGDLKTSVIRDLNDFFGGIFSMTSDQSPMKGLLSFKGADKIPIECEIDFYAFDRPEETDKIKSAKYTAGAIIEAQSLPSMSVISDIWARCGRYPSNSVDDIEEEEVEDNKAIVWENPELGISGKGKFLVFDFNYKSVKHFLYEYLVTNNPVLPNGELARKVYAAPELFIPVLLRDWDGVTKGVRGIYKGDEVIFIRNPEANEYVKFNGWKYWEDMLIEYMYAPNKIIRDVIGRWSPETEGKPVYPEFNRERHVSRSVLNFRKGVKVYVGVDNGFNNAWVFCQPDGAGKLRVCYIINNVVDDAKSIESALDSDVIPFMEEVLEGYQVKFIVDQAMASREAGKETTQLDPFIERNLDFELSTIKRTKPVIALVRDYIIRDKLAFSPNCTDLIEAMDGGYHHRLIKATGLYESTPYKNEYSHVAEALSFVVEYVDQLFHKRKPNKQPTKRNKYSDI